MLNGNRNVPYLNDWNDRKLNLNWWNDEWNDNYRFLAVRNFLFWLIILGGLVYQLASPSSEHLANFRKEIGNVCVPLVIECLNIPSELQHEF